MKTLPTAAQQEKLAILTGWINELLDCYNSQDSKEVACKYAQQKLHNEIEDLRESLKERDATIEKLLNGFAAIRVMLGIDKGVDLMNALAKRLNYEQPECEKPEPTLEDIFSGPFVVYAINTWTEDER